MLTATRDLMLPATVTGSWPRPRWYDQGLWGRPLDTALLDVRFREQFLDAHATVLADQTRAGLDILTNGDYHLDEDFAGRSWHHYPLQRWKGLEHEELQYERSRDSLLAFPPGTLMNEIETTWRWPRYAGSLRSISLLDLSALTGIAVSANDTPRGSVRNGASIVTPPERPRRRLRDVHGHQGPHAPGDRHRLLAAAALV